jgi:hypothetical protein
MYFDDQDLRNLRAAAKNTDDDLYQNLQHMIDPQWVCERTADPDTVCHGAHVEPCEGFKLVFGRGSSTTPIIVPVRYVTLARMKSTRSTS